MRQKKDAAGRKEAREEEEGKKCGEGTFEEINKHLFVLFRVLGLVTFRRVAGRYQVNTLHFFVSYLAWTTAPYLVYTASVAWLQRKGSAQPYHLGGTFVSLVLCLMPAVQTYSIKYINQSLPATLDRIDSLVHLQPGFKTPLTAFECRKIVIIKKEVANGKTKKFSERLVHWLPLTMVVTSGVAVCVTLALKVLERADIKNCVKGLPLLASIMLFQCLLVASTFFIAAFLKWLTRVYAQLAKHCELTSTTWTQAQASIQCGYLEQLQQLFTKMNDGFLLYTVSTNMFSVSISSILCLINIYVDYNIMYVGPLVGNVMCLVVLSGAADNLVKAVRFFH